MMIVVIIIYAISYDITLHYIVVYYIPRLWQRVQASAGPSAPVAADMDTSGWAPLDPSLQTDGCCEESRHVT